MLRLYLYNNLLFANLEQRKVCSASDRVVKKKNRILREKKINIDALRSEAAAGRSWGGEAAAAPSCSSHLLPSASPAHSSPSLPLPKACGVKRLNSTTIVVLIWEAWRCTRAQLPLPFAPLCFSCTVHPASSCKGARGHGGSSVEHRGEGED